ncbi:MAG: zinc ribbon domain-containing protein [Prevotella sp.]|jgi:hypothetical protein
MIIKRNKIIYRLLTGIICLCSAVALSSCYHHGSRIHDAQLSAKQLDSLSFFSTHHYTNNYNFVVKADSLCLIKQLPEEVVSGMNIDTFAVYHNAHLVVADIRMIPTDPQDSVWVQLANDTSAFGWAHESYLLPKVVPDDPISQFISTFSDTHLLIFLIIIVGIGACYLMRQLLRRNAPIVHFNDIESFYPTLLCLIVASSAALYATIQNFSPELWEHFYYHPTLNPFSVPFTLSVFLFLVWAMVIVSLAALDDIFHQLSFGGAVLYSGGLIAVCSIVYILFSITTLYYFGYVLLLLYIVFALHQYFHHNRATYLCGKCGAPLHHKGRCPHCGAINE